MTEAEKLERKKKITKICMIALTVSFIVLMLIIPLITVITGALKEGFSFYIKAVSTEYVANATIKQAQADLSAEGKDEEEAAALMGAGGFKIFTKITLPQIKWGLVYGIILCTARALGEFGAVNALSKTRGETFTLPLEIDALYMSGTKESVTAAFAVSSLLVLIAVVVLVLKNILEYKTKRKSRK